MNVLKNIYKKIILEEFARSGPNVTKEKERQAYIIGPNQLLWDMGVDNVYNEPEVNNKIKEMDETFHLVMIMEYFKVT